MPGVRGWRRLRAYSPKWRHFRAAVVAVSSFGCCVTIAGPHVGDEVLAVAFPAASGSTGQVFHHCGGTALRPPGRPEHTQLGVKSIRRKKFRRGSNAQHPLSMKEPWDWLTESQQGDKPSKLYEDFKDNLPLAKRTSVFEEDETVKTFTIDESHTQRLDTFLADKYQYSRHYFSKLADQGAVLVDGKQRKKAFNKFKSGMAVEVRFLANERELSVEGEDIPLDVVYEDADMLVLNKPPGIVIHPAPGHWNGTLLNAVVHHVGAGGGDALPERSGHAERPGVVHRLDVGTSGIITFAKTQQALASLMQAFAMREVKKTYLTIAVNSRMAYRGYASGGGHLVDFPIGRSEAIGEQMCVLPEAQGGRPSVSFVRELARADAENNRHAMSLLEVSPRTGRTHQIRVHLKEMNTPVLGDDTYGMQRVNKYHKAIRPLLHAHKLELTHPRTGERMLFEAPLPQDMRKLLEIMSPSDSAPDAVETVESLLEGVDERPAGEAEALSKLRHGHLAETARMLRKDALGTALEKWEQSLADERKAALVLRSTAADRGVPASPEVLARMQKLRDRRDGVDRRQAKVRLKPVVSQRDDAEQDASDEDVPIGQSADPQSEDRDGPEVEPPGRRLVRT